jgi:hypothetical protein
MRSSVEHVKGAEAVQTRYGLGGRIAPNKTNVNEQRFQEHSDRPPAERSRPRPRYSDQSRFAHHKVGKSFVDHGRNLSDGQPLAIQASVGRLMDHKIEGTKGGAFFTNVSAE